MESARSMIHSSNAPLWLWSEAVAYAVYILNRVPSKDSIATPFELFYKIKPDVSNIKVFGSRTFVFITDQERSKIEKKFVEGMLVGFDENQKGYRVYIPSERKVIISRNVRIDETVMYSKEMDNPSAMASLIDSPLDPFKYHETEQVSN
jgi:hypothetical protein